MIAIYHPPATRSELVAHAQSRAALAPEEHAQEEHAANQRAQRTSMSVEASISAALTLAGSLAAGELGRLEALPPPDAELLATTLAAVAAAVFDAEAPEPARRQSSATYALQWARCALHYDRSCRMAQLYEAKALDRLGKRLGLAVSSYERLASKADDEAGEAASDACRTEAMRALHSGVSPSLQPESSVVSRLPPRRLTPPLEALTLDLTASPTPYPKQVPPRSRRRDVTRRRGRRRQGQRLEPGASRQGRRREGVRAAARRQGDAGARGRAGAARGGRRAAPLAQAQLARALPRGGGRPRRCTGMHMPCACCEFCMCVCIVLHVHCAPSVCVCAHQ